jgi:hypothetical protein
MGLFGRKKPKEQKQSVTLTAVEFPSGWRMKAVGSSFRQEALEDALRSASKTPPGETENLTKFCKRYPGAGLSVINEYKTSLTDGRLPN